MLLDLIENLRNRTNEFRNSIDFNRGGSLTLFFTNVIQISICLSEIGLLRGREISVQEEYWFQAYYHLTFELSGSDFQDLLDNYRSLVTEIERRNYFRKGT